MMKRYLQVILLLACTMAACANPVQASPTPLPRANCLLTDYRVNPLGIDRRPNLSWRMEAGGRHGAAQTTYRIQSSSSAENLAAGTFLWDSGLVESNASTQIAYGGPELQSGERVWWQVKIRDENGRMSDWSDPAWFEAGLPGEDDWRGAQWIACDRKMDEPKMAPREIMGSWIPASGEGRVDAFTVEFELPDVPVVSAMAWWGVAGRGAKPVVSIEGRVHPGIVSRAMRGNRGYVDLSFQLAPGQLNVLRLDHFEISGLSREPAPGEVLVYQIGNDAPQTATFESSDPLLNRLFENGLRSHYGNMINSLLECPHREKCLWGGDLHASWALGFHAIDSASFYRHQVRLSYTGPTAPGGIPGNIMVGKRLTASSSSFNWSVSPLFITWWLHRHFGDLDTAGEFYGPMRNFLHPDIERQSQRSLNHHAANHPAAWLITDLAGMRLDEAVPGGRRLILAPFIPGSGSPERVKASMRTPHGLVESAWMMKDGAFEWLFTVPPNVTAEVRIPAHAGAEILGAETLSLLRREDGCAVYEAVAGSHAVRIRPGRNR